MLLLPTLFFLCGLVDGRAFYEKNKPNPDLIFGDILITEREKQIRDWPENARMATFIQKTWGSGRNFRWPNNIMPYTISNKFNDDEKRLIRDALKELEEKSCFKFPERRSEKDYVEYDDLGGGCYTAVGKSIGKQPISLSKYCRNDRASIQHETMHKLGISHEHQRPDRDQYIDVIRENIESNGESQLRPDDLKLYEYTGLPYDVHSIMHYDGFTYGKQRKDGQQMVTMKIKGTNTPVPENTELSELDVKRLLLLGKCPGAPSTSPKLRENNPKQMSKRRPKKETKKKPKKETKRKKTDNKKAPKMMTIDPSDSVGVTDDSIDSIDSMTVTDNYIDSSDSIEESVE